VDVRKDIAGVIAETFFSDQSDACKRRPHRLSKTVQRGGKQKINTLNLRDFDSIIGSFVIV